jgi:hypothetical protein
MRRDQQRAIWAYRKAAEMRATNLLEDYETAVQSFAAALLRNGLAVAVSILERSADREEYKRLLGHLAGWEVQGMATCAESEWPGQIRAIADLQLYMQITREFIALASWLRRACRALQPTG